MPCSATTHARRRRRRCASPEVKMPPLEPGGLALGAYTRRLRDCEAAPIYGHVTRVVGLVVESKGPRARVGDVCELRRADGGDVLPLEVVGFRDGRLMAVPLGDTS